MALVAKRMFVLKNIGSGSVYISDTDSYQIEGVYQYTLAANKSIILASNGSAWYIVSQF